MSSEVDELLARIRLLSAIEYAVPELLADTAARARELGASWDLLGRQAGFTRSRAHQRWSKNARGVTSEPSRHDRLRADMLRELTPAQLALMPEIFGEISKLVRSPRTSNFCADVIRQYLSYEARVNPDDVRHGSVTLFRIASRGLSIRCAQEGSDTSGEATVTLKDLFDDADAPLEAVRIGLDGDRTSLRVELEHLIELWLQTHSRLRSSD